jgi:hypothetical protein
LFEGQQEKKRRRHLRLHECASWMILRPYKSNWRRILRQDLILKSFKMNLTDGNFTRELKSLML